MTFRGVFRNGVIVPQEGMSLPNGTVVDIRAGKQGRRQKPATKATSRSEALKQKRSRKTREDEPVLEGFGMWKNRADWRGKSTLEVARELRRKAMGDRYRG
jgi:hypothetical protein